MSALTSQKIAHYERRIRKAVRTDPTFKGSITAENIRDLAMQHAIRASDDPASRYVKRVARILKCDVLSAIGALRRAAS